jgi:hypothetical protein
MHEEMAVFFSNFTKLHLVHLPVAAKIIKYLG